MTVEREGNFCPDRFGDGCGKDCRWNGGGYYGEVFHCGTTYPSGKTFYCSDACYCRLGSTTRVFVSYAWRDKPVVDRLTGAFAAREITYLRDINEVGAFGSIADFMAESASARFFVVVLSQAYFASRNCMYELVELMRSNLSIRVVPVILDDAGFRVPTDSLVEPWRKRCAVLEGLVEEIGPHHANSLCVELSVTREIVAQLARFHSDLSAAQLPTAEALLANDCAGAAEMLLRTVGEPPLGSPAADRRPPAPPPVRDAGATRTRRWSVLVTASGAGVGSSVAGEIRAAISAAHDVFADDDLGFAAFCAVEPYSAQRFLVCVIDEDWLRSAPQITRAVLAYSTLSAHVIPIFLDAGLFAATSEVPYIKWWRDEAARTDFSIDTAENGMWIGSFIASQRVKVMPDLASMRADGFVALRRMLDLWEPGPVQADRYVRRMLGTDQAPAPRFVWITDLAGRGAGFFKLLRGLLDEHYCAVRCLPEFVCYDDGRWFARADVPGLADGRVVFALMATYDDVLLALPIPMPAVLRDGTGVAASDGSRWTLDDEGNLSPVGTAPA